MFKVTGLLTACLFFLSSMAGYAAEPPLPPGLDVVEEPALPSGLEPAQPGGLAPSDEPALPSGLEPPLPGGLTPSTEPTLPSGLEPALPDGLGEDAPVSEEAASGFSAQTPPLTLRGFWDMRAGSRIQSDKAQSKDATLGEMRLQLRTDKSWDKVFFEFTGDGVFDAVDERARLDIRQMRLTWTPVDMLDIRIGRQVLTWGTGDMLFINDLFPKDWVSFFSGRDTEYLKAPSNAVRVGWFHEWLNVEVVYSPQFDSDRHITGKRISYYNPLAGGSAGREQQLKTDKPDDWFDDDEIALRLYRTIGSTQVALYGYSGYWKSPGGMQLLTGRATFPKLRVYGASVRGAIGRGIGHAEVGYYDSYQDGSGRNPFINNSEFRMLLGYEREIARELTMGVQYYLEYMMDYGRYRQSLPFFMVARDRDRHVFTLRLTKLLMNQNLILSFFGYMSPSDRDAYLRPAITYKINDHWTVETGGNVFLGAHSTSFFGQFKDNTNVYASVRLFF